MSVILFTGEEGLPHCMLGYTPQGPGTPLRDQAPPPPPSTVHAGRYGQQAGGTHPTGMQSCYSMNLFFIR